MAVIIFLLGRPGSGKSQIARCIKDNETLATFDLKEKCLLENWLVEHVTDYPVLQEMFQKEQDLKAQGRFERERFCIGDQELGGFTVIDFSVLQTALTRVNESILHTFESSRKLIIVEYARNNYIEALEAFDQRILAHAHFLYFEADRKICKDRIAARVAHRQFEDDNFVSEQIMDGYYQQDDFPLLQKALGPEKLKVIKNDGGLAEIWPQVREYVQEWCLLDRQQIIHQEGVRPQPMIFGDYYNSSVKMLLSYT